MPEKKKVQRRPQQGKKDRFMQPSILMGLYTKPSYGYELIQNIQRFGFIEGSAPPGMIYRHLRQMEEDGLVSSEWETRDVGPAKRIYQLTEEGKQMLGLWIEYIEKQVGNLNELIRQYYELKEKGA
ncbi:MAG TPA: helix-turn-helix transcriptional regulator [Syntrophobacteraceae bacterium]|nr:helix-turn-helix transcriptional regulator [Syntrophobacteraceae bacterium]